MVEKANQLKYGETNLLYFSCYHDDEEYVRSIITQPSKLGISPSATPLHWACQAGSNNVVKTLIELNYDVDLLDTGHWTPLHYASRRGFPSTVKILLQAGADVNSVSAKGETPLIIASRAGHLDVVSELLKVPGIDVNAKDRKLRSALFFACRGNILKIIEQLVEHGAIINTSAEKWWTPLHACCKRGNPSMVFYLLLQGADKEARTMDGETPLMVACKYNPDVAVVLITSGAKVNVSWEINADTPLHFASRKANHELFLELILHGADVDKPNARGQTALYLASACGFKQYVMYLLDFCHAEVNATTCKQDTALHVACRQKHVEIVELLLQNGANPSLRNARGMTPMNCAGMCWDVVDVLMPWV